MEVLTAWKLEPIGEYTVYMPLLALRYRGRVIDTTGQSALQSLPQPNLLVVDFWCVPEDRDALEADSDFYILHQDNESEVPSAAEFGQLRSYLGQQGVDQEDLNSAVGNAPNGRTRQEITEELKVWLRTLT